VRRVKDTYIDASQGGIPIGVEHLYAHLVSLGVNCRCDEPSDVESNLNELCIVPQGLYNM
jgi:hypothetical protein